ncbi:MAG: GNAT family N-acetyltransferase [Victivallaceae bacterium]|nr:GNAT family N-acetyltransferase [Victivallaceae bacterium]
MNKIILKPVSRNELDMLYNFFMGYSKKSLLRNLGFIPDKQELEYHFFDDPDCEAELLLGAYINNQLNGFIHAIRRPWKSGSSTTGYLKWLQVNEADRHRTTIGRSLLTAIEQQLSALGCEQLQFGSASPYYLIPGVPTEDEFTRSLLNLSGWLESSERISLQINPDECDLDGLLFAKLQNDNNSCSLSNITAPEPKLQNFITEHFSASWAMEIEFGLKNIPQAHCSVLKNATSDIIGFAAVHAVNRNWFGPMGILPELRGQGLGKLILLHAMREASTTGINSLILSWVNDKADFYRKIFPSAINLFFKKTVKYL